VLELGQTTDMKKPRSGSFRDRPGRGAMGTSVFVILVDDAVSFDVEVLSRLRPRERPRRAVDALEHQRLSFLIWSASSATMIHGRRMNVAAVVWAMGAVVVAI
jgi:hypothetical protein